MKKILAVLTALMLCITLMPAAIAADTVTVNITISSAGELVVASKSVTVKDTDGDGALTVNDAISAAHDAFYKGGAKAGYLASEGDWGLSIEKLWGIENGGSYGYYRNNGMCMSLSDTISDGDYIAAYSYSDLTNWSDCYSYFDKTAYNGADVALTLSVLSYDANWNLVSSPAAGAVIYIDGKATSYKTDANGKVKLGFDKAGTYTVSAKSDSQTIVPPVCIVTSNGAAGGKTTVSAPAASGNSYTVLSGDCLWTICEKVYGNGAKWGELFSLNSDVLANPRLIYPGQVLKLF